MSKRGYISRYLLILKKLKHKPYSSFEELQEYIQNQLEFIQDRDEDLNIGFSKRTLQRDIKEISNVFGIDIEYSRVAKGYYISHAESENMNFQRMMEAFDVFNSLNLAQELSPYFDLEKQQPLGTEHLYGILHAIKNNFLIKFYYQKFWEDQISQRTVQPLALKEFKNRWYIVSKDLKDNFIKTFALDRISDLEISNTKFTYPSDFDVRQYFYNCFGIMSPVDLPLEEITLSFDPIQGKYIKSLPLHHSQKIIEDNNQALMIKIKLHITHDFIMELLSYGDSVKVIAPKHLQHQITNIYSNALRQYK